MSQKGKRDNVLTNVELPVSLDTALERLLLDVREETGKRPSKRLLICWLIQGFVDDKDKQQAFRAFFDERNSSPPDDQSGR
jgi:hypothetical protein